MRNRNKVIAASAAVLTAAFITAFATSQSAEHNATFDNVTAAAQHAPCTELDYVGDSTSPESVILRCSDGDTVTISEPFTNKRVTSSEGKHYVYSVVAVDGEWRVWYDDSLVVRDQGFEQSKSKMTKRNFSESTVSWSEGWK